MAFLNFIFKPKNELEDGGRTTAEPAPVQADESEPETTCPNCHKQIPMSKLVADQNVCECGHHFRIAARQRLSFIADKDSFKELFADVTTNDPIDFPGYGKKIELTKTSSRETEAVICAEISIYGNKCAVFAMEPYFMMGSMGTAVGERLARLFEYAIDNSLPVIGFSVSGGARMQEGLASLMQMAKVSGAVKKHSDAGLLYVVVLTDPTTGGVTASFAMEGDIILAEPGATVGFAGARVIEQTTRRPLPKGFQTSEFIQEHGFADAIVPRKNQKKVLARILELHQEVETE